MNAVIFRTASIASHGGTQYVAYYDDSAHVVLAMRRIGSPRWTVARTSFTNDVTDAHNAIAIAVDGSGVLHVAWAETTRRCITRGPSAPARSRWAPPSR